MTTWELDHIGHFSSALMFTCCSYFNRCLLRLSESIIRLHTVMQREGEDHKKLGRIIRNMI